MPSVNCPVCRRPANVPDSDSTLTARCPHCLAQFDLPVDGISARPQAPGRRTSEDLESGGNSASAGAVRGVLAPVMETAARARAVGFWLCVWGLLGMAHSLATLWFCGWASILDGPLLPRPDADANERFLGQFGFSACSFGLMDLLAVLAGRAI